jgi:hypothetical protein
MNLKEEARRNWMEKRGHGGAKIHSREREDERWMDGQKSAKNDGPECSKSAGFTSCLLPSSCSFV